MHSTQRGYAAILCTVALAGCGASQDVETRTVTRTASLVRSSTAPVVFAGPRANYTFSVTSSGVVVTDTTGAAAPVTLTTDAQMRFADQSVSVDVNGQAGRLYRLYQAAFGRTPDAAGLGYWLDLLNRGVPIDDIARDFVASSEFTSLFGSAASLSNRAITATFYQNVLGRAGEPAGIDFWAGVLDGGTARNAVLLGFTDSPENRGLVDPSIAGGITFFAPGVTYTGIGAAAKMSVVGTPPATGALGATITMPDVLVQNAAGQPLANVRVDFKPGTNNGQVASASAYTNAAGVVTIPAWTLGAAPGPQVLTASVAGALRTRFEVATTIAAGCTSSPAAVGFSYAGSWTGNDCTAASNGARYDEYTFVTTGQSKFKMNLAGHAGRKFTLLDSTGRVVGDMPADAFSPAAASAIEFRYALPAGTYRLRPTATDASTLGDYVMKLSPDFTTRIVDRSICGPVVFTTFGAVIEESLSPETSCSFQGDVEDRYIILLRQGESFELSLESAAFGPWLGLRDDRSPTAPLLVKQSSQAAGAVKVSHTATFTGFHEIIVTTASGALGAYKLSIVKK